MPAANINNNLDPLHDSPAINYIINDVYTKNHTIHRLHNLSYNPVFALHFLCIGLFTVELSIALLVLVLHHKRWSIVFGGIIVGPGWFIFGIYTLNNRVAIPLDWLGHITLAVYRVKEGVIAKRRRLKQAFRDNS